jgi:hypothetical protein
MSASKARRAVTAKRRTDAITLRLAGMDWTSIADRLGYSDRGAACKDVTRALEANIVEQRVSAEELREVELLRLDRLQAAVWGAAVQGDLRAIETCLKILDRRAKLLGLDSAIKLEVLTIDAIDAQLQQLEAQLRDTAAFADLAREGGEAPPTA